MDLEQHSRTPSSRRSDPTVPVAGRGHAPGARAARPPPPLAARAGRLLGRRATVVEVEQLSPGLRRVRFHAPGPSGRSRWAGQEIEFGVAERETRRYTALAVDPAADRFDVVFARAADGPGTRWAWALRPGDVALARERDRRVPRGRRELLLGDVTALGLFAALLRDARGATGAVEVPEPDREAAAALVPGLDVVAAGGRPARALRAWLTEHLPAVGRVPPVLPDRACLAGNARAIQQLRSRLWLTGLPRPAIALRAHWDTGRRGL